MHSWRSAISLSWMVCAFQPWARSGSVLSRRVTASAGRRSGETCVHADILNVTTHVSCLLGGKLIRANVYLPPKVKLPWFSPALLEAEVNRPESQRGRRQLSFTFLKRGVLS